MLTWEQAGDQVIAEIRAHKKVQANVEVNWVETFPELTAAARRYRDEKRHLDNASDNFATYLDRMGYSQ